MESRQLQLYTNYPLKHLNSLQLPGAARRFVQIKTEQDVLALVDFLKSDPEDFFILGGGTNIILSGDVKALVIEVGILGKYIRKRESKITENQALRENSDKPATAIRAISGEGSERADEAPKDAEILRTHARPATAGENSNSVDASSMGEDLYFIGAGESWADAVDYATRQGLSGLENLSAIPGTAGAAPVQNIGAYGLELKDVLDHLTAYHLRSGEKKVFSREDCEFSYRDSFFKRAEGKDWLIVNICLRLKREFKPELRYPDILNKMQAKNWTLTDLNAHRLSDLVKEIRAEKLPAPEVLPNAGSFFKNPIVSKEHYEELAKKWGSLPHFPYKPGWVKIPAAFLIDSCGLKGFRMGAFGVSERHALVITHPPPMEGNFWELKNLYTKIREDVKNKFGLELELEPQVI